MYFIVLCIQATLVIRDLTLRVFAITRFRGKKAVRKLYSNCAVTVYGGGVTVWRPRTSWSHLTNISVRGSVELANPVDVERSSFIFKKVGK
jgi:hypothetical protein